jgi:hypothetical protein
MSVAENFEPPGRKAGGQFRRSNDTGEALPGQAMHQIKVDCRNANGAQ